MSEPAKPAKPAKPARTITREQRERLGELIADSRALGEIQDRLTKLAEDITEDWEMNSHTFDVCSNNKTATVDDLLELLGITVVDDEPPADPMS